MKHINLILTFLILLATIIILIYVTPKQENFASLNCDKYMKTFGDCNNFLDTIYNGGLQLTNDVKQCQQLCYERAFKI